MLAFVCNGSELVQWLAKQFSEEGLGKFVHTKLQWMSGLCWGNFSEGMWLWLLSMWVDASSYADVITFLILDLKYYSSISVNCLFRPAPVINNQ